MALWQIISTTGGKLPQWDDGAATRPGEPGFSTAAVTAYAGAKNFNFIGTPNWAPPIEPPAADQG